MSIEQNNISHIQRLTILDRDDNPISPTCVFCGKAEEFCNGTIDKGAIRKAQETSRKNEKNPLWWEEKDLNKKPTIQEQVNAIYPIDDLGYATVHDLRMHLCALIKVLDAERANGKT